MKTIPLTRGFTTLVDDSDYDLYGSRKWFSTHHKGIVYAARRERIDGKWVTIYLHRLISQARFLGMFTTATEAARAYDTAAIEYYGQFAKTNAAMGLLPCQSEKP